ncbi:MAG: ribonuclease HII [Promethearchaeota archaeon]
MALKGSVLGPLVICGICFPKSKLDFLNELGIKDSKKLTKKKRQGFLEILKTNCHSHVFSIITSKEIDARHENKLSLNQLEELKIKSIINELKPDIIYIDAADVNEERFGHSILKALNYRPKQLVSKHKADDLFPIVSAASILAKEMRDHLIEKLKKKNGPIGSGYPSDAKTIEFLRNYIKTHKTIPNFARKSWSTIKKLLDEELYNRKISDYF